MVAELEEVLGFPDITVLANYFFCLIIDVWNDYGFAVQTAVIQLRVAIVRLAFLADR